MELTERSSQLGLLERRLADLLRGGTSPTDRPVTVLTGPVGSGKTALSQTFARRACDAGARVIGASASRASAAYRWRSSGSSSARCRRAPRTPRHPGPPRPA
ncbi:hypothetical protein V2I01_31495 [Micromonospora sp. BRA006-A]|nr:hypothetical protein [Micromonospora sp. BRA006-A]